ncbi:hypothetical protein D9M72_492450 [compost metagenome]
MPSKIACSNTAPTIRAVSITSVSSERLVSTLSEIWNRYTGMASTRMLVTIVKIITIIRFCRIALTPALRLAEKSTGPRRLWKTPPPPPPPPLPLDEPPPLPGDRSSALMGPRSPSITTMPDGELFSFISAVGQITGRSARRSGFCSP